MIKPATTFAVYALRRPNPTNYACQPRLLAGFVGIAQRQHNLRSIHARQDNRVTPFSKPLRLWRDEQLIRECS